MSVSYDGGFLTKAKGDEDKVIWVNFNNGASRPMKRAKKRCLDDVAKLEKSLHHLPSQEEWQKEPHFISLSTVDKLFGSYNAMLKEFKKLKNPLKTPKNRNAVKIYRIDQVQREDNDQGINQDARSDSKRMIIGAMSKERVFSNLEIAQILYEACDGKEHITLREYKTWRKLQDKKVPSHTTIIKHLGGGRWSPQLFNNMRRLLKLNQSESKSSNDLSV